MADDLDLRRAGPPMRAEAHAGPEGRPAGQDHGGQAAAGLRELEEALEEVARLQLAARQRDRDAHAAAGRVDDRTDGDHIAAAQLDEPARTRDLDRDRPADEICGGKLPRRRDGSGRADRGGHDALGARAVGGEPDREAPMVGRGRDARLARERLECQLPLGPETAVIRRRIEQAAALRGYLRLDHVQAAGPVLDPVPEWRLTAAVRDL